MDKERVLKAIDELEQTTYLKDYINPYNVYIKGVIMPLQAEIGRQLVGSPEYERLTNQLEKEMDYADQLMTHE